MNPKAEALIIAVGLRPRARIFVEIGCIRRPSESATEGFSTVYLAQVAKARRGLLHSVDLSPDSISVARAAVKAPGLSDSVSFHQERGVDWLKEYVGLIDFLHLDGNDDPQMNLEEFQAAEPKLVPDAMVCVDDCHTYNGFKFGKGDKVIPYATDRGWTVQLIPTLNPWRMAILRRCESATLAPVKKSSTSRNDSQTMTLLSVDRAREAKRILMISTHGYFEVKPSYGLPDTGGQVAYVIELSLALAKLGYQVDILTRKFDDFPQIEEINQRVRIIRIPAGGRDFIPKEYLVKYLPELVAGFVGYNDLEYEFIDSHYWDGGFVGTVLAGTFGIPHVFTPHSIGIWKKMEMERAAIEQDIELKEKEFEGQHNFKQRIETEKTIMSRADRVIATSPQQEDIINKKYGISKKITVITPGFDPDKYRRMEEHSLKKAVEKHRLPPRFVLAVGRITPYKGHDLLLKAMKYVIEEMPDIKLVLRIGSQNPTKMETEKKNELLRAVRDLDLADHVLFYDYVDDIEVFYNAAEVLVLPSTYEPFGMVAIEAMACGTPAVLTTEGGLKDLLEDGQDALFVDPADTRALANAILRLLGNRTLHDQISKWGYDKSHSLFTWEIIAKKLLRTIGLWEARDERH